jgi:glucose dehydrogenase
VRQTLSPEDAWGITFWDRNVCRDKFKALRFEGIYTPPSEQGTLMYPGNAGGSNWGGVAVDLNDPDNDDPRQKATIHFQPDFIDRGGVTPRIRHSGFGTPHEDPGNRANRCKPKK